MAEYTKRVQILLTGEQHDFLAELSERRQRSVGDLVRTAFEEVYRPARSIRELQTLRNLQQTTYIEESATKIFEDLAKPRFG